MKNLENEENKPKRNTFPNYCESNEYRDTGRSSLLVERWCNSTYKSESPASARRMERDMEII
jgi:hypothetical protein